MRLQKFLSRAGVASRRRSETLIQAGRVEVNGTVVTEMGTRVEPDRDRVRVDGRLVALAPPRWIVLHKPPGVLTTASDPGGDPTVYDLLPPDARALRYVGRLDRDTEGLLLLSNQGDLIHRLTHPSYSVEREYRVTVKGRPEPPVLRRLEEGVLLEDGPARAARAWRPPGAGPDELAMILVEGRKREVRRMMESVGHPVVRLRRVRYGPVALGNLAPGEWRELAADEVQGLERVTNEIEGPPGGAP